MRFVLADVQHYQYCWVVDPIDGTKEFIKRNGEFTVMIGLVQVTTSLLDWHACGPVHAAPFGVQRLSRVSPVGLHLVCGLTNSVLDSTGHSWINTPCCLVAMYMHLCCPGCVQDKAPVFGVVHVPVTGKTYYAVAGKGAYLREADGSTKQILCKEFAVGQPNLVVVGSASHANPTNNTGR